jgi:hypothetical protein
LRQLQTVVGQGQRRRDGNTQGGVGARRGRGPRRRARIATEHTRSDRLREGDPATAHDAGKTDADWYWLIGYLAGKALHNPPEQVPDWNWCDLCGHRPSAIGGYCSECDVLTHAVETSSVAEVPALIEQRKASAKTAVEKQLHRIITVAAAAANWHAAKLGKTNMRPGIDGEAALDGEGEA